jgi:hypothetical protein
MDPEHKELMQSIAVSMNLIRAELAENTRSIGQILKGFPEGDPDGHRRYHEEVIQQMSERRKLRQEILTHLLKASSWPALAGVCYVLWKYFKSQVTG